MNGMDNQCSNGEALQELALFAGAGGVDFPKGQRHGDIYDIPF